MVDENLMSTNVSHKRRSQLSSSSCGDTYMDDYDENDTVVNDEMSMKIENNGAAIYETSTSSPESENNFNFNGRSAANDDKTLNISSDKKVHWNPTQVHALLDCIEKRMNDFKRKSVHKSVWISIGKEMSEHGEFSVEHCYNKWKNLRRDIRLFANSNSMQKLSIRNAFIMERVQKMVNEIGYEMTSSRKSSSSPLSPNIIDVMNVQESTNNTEEMTEDQLVQSKEQPLLSNNNTHNNNSNNNSNSSNSNNNNNNNNNMVIEETILSLLSDPAVSQAILMNPKLIEDILPGIDISNLIHRIIQTRPDIVASISQNSVPLNPNVTTYNSSESSQIKVERISNNKTALNEMDTGVTKPPPIPPSVTAVNYNNQDSVINSSHNINHVVSGTSWPHQLYELLHSFRDEESRQMQRLDQIINYVNVMQDSTKRRLNTINQLLSLAGLLIPQK